MGLDPVEHIEDAELVRLAQEGDRWAFDVLVRRHQNGVFTLALRLTADYSLAGDVSQEAFVRAWRALGKFRGDAQFSTWMHRIVVNTAWTAKRRQGRHRHSPIDDFADMLEATGQTPDEAAAQRELRGLLSEAVQTLPWPQRSVLVLKDVYGWSHQEIADELGISVTAAKVRLHRARRRLQVFLEERR